MIKPLKTLSAYIIILCIFLLGVSRASAYTDEGVVLWTSGGDVLGRTYSDITGKLGAPFTALSGIDAKFINIKASPTKKEFILGIQDTSGVLRVYHSTDGISWVSDWSVSLGNGNVARFDIAYEQLTGRAIVAYRGRIQTGRTTFYYRIWSGTAWGTQTELRSSSGGYTGNIVNMKLASRPGSNQIGMVYVDDKYYAVPVFWSGSVWTFSGTPVTTNSSRYSGFIGTFPPLSSVSVAFESVSGDMLVVAGQNDSDKLHYMTRSSTGTWSAVSALSTFAGYGDYSRLVPSRTTNEIALTSCMMEPNGGGGPSYMCDFALWNGSSFGSVTSDTASGAIQDGDVPTDAIVLEDGGSKVAIAAYDAASTGGVDTYLSVNGGSFSAQSPETVAPPLSAHEGEVSALAISGLSNAALFGVIDENNEIYLKRATQNGPAVSWNSVAPLTSAEISQGSNPAASSNFARMDMSLQMAPSVIVISTTTANTVHAIPSGATSYVADASCTSATDCTGFELIARGKNDITLSRIALTHSGTLDLTQTSGWELGIDNDANPNNGVLRTIAGSVVGNTIIFNFSSALSIASGERYYAFPRATFGTNPYPVSGETIILGINATTDIDTSATPTNDEYIIGSPKISGIITPVITSYTNVTEPGLSYQSGCTLCGARLGPSALGHEVTISGRGFGNTLGGGSVSISGNSETVIAAANIQNWSNSSITIRFDSSVSTNTDADFGDNYGGTSGLVVKVSGQTASIDFSLFPQITGLITPIIFGPDSAREYNVSDQDGVVTLIGTRFGAAQQSSVVLVLGCSATVCGTPANSVYVESWSDSAVKIRVPTVIANNVYSGKISLARNYMGAPIAPSVDYKNQFYIMPRVTAILPSLGGSGDAVSLSGDHFCPLAGVCPTGAAGVDTDVSAAPAFSLAHHVQIGGATADYWTSWSDTAIATKVPGGAIVGLGNASVTAGGFPAGQVPFTVLRLDGVDAVTALVQRVSGAPAHIIPVGGYASTTEIRFDGILSGAASAAATIRLVVEVVPVGTNFSCGDGACATAKVGAWAPFVGTDIDCSILANNCAVSATLPDNVYHWRARAELVSNSVSYYGPWSSYPISPTNLESSADLTVESAPVVIFNLGAGTPGTNDATISWSTNKNADTLLQINKTGIFTDTCIAANGCAGASPAFVITHDVSVSKLSANTTYYYRVRAQDIAGNVTWSAVQSFKTMAVAKPAKTLFFHAISKGGVLPENSSADSTFTIVVPESLPEFQSIFVDARGMYQTSGAEANAALRIWVNGEPYATYTLPGGSSIVAPWRIFHRVQSLKLSPGINTIGFSTLADTELSGISADIILTYLYEP